MQEQFKDSVRRRIKIRYALISYIASHSDTRIITLLILSLSTLTDYNDTYYPKQKYSGAKEQENAIPVNHHN